MDKDNNSFLMLELSNELKEEFKQQCKEEDLTMKQLGRRIIKEYLARVKNESCK